MTDYQAHPTAVIDDGAVIGAGTSIWHYSHVYAGASIGGNCSLGQNTMVADGAVIGSNVKIQNNVAIYAGVTIEDDVFLGPSCVLTNVTNPRSQVVRKGIYESTLIRRGATLGANSTVVCGTTLGRYCFIAAGAVITRDVPDYALISGVPGKQVGWMSRHGHRLDFDASTTATCPESGLSYQLDESSGHAKVVCVDLDDEEPLPARLAVGTTPYRAVASSVSQPSPPPIAFIDLAEQQSRIRPEIDSAIRRVLDHGRYVMGPEVDSLESSLAEFVGVRHCVAVSSGTDALLIALMSQGVGSGDAVITSPFTFFATVEAIMLCGATPIFADIDRHTFNICPAEVSKAIHRVQSRTDLKLRGIIPVDLYGLPADYDQIIAIAKQHQLFVLQDAAQAFGATRDGKSAPSHGDIGVTSFFPAKPLGCYGDGGAVFTDDDQTAEVIRSIRVHGQGVDKYDNARVGLNARMDTIQAAILNEKLKIYPDELVRRQQVADRYQTGLSAQTKNEIGTIRGQIIPAACQSAWAQFVIRVKNRDEVVQRLSDQGIPTAVYYRTPAHLMGACRELPAAIPLPNAETAAGEVLAVPFHPYLSESVIDQVCRIVMGVDRRESA